MRRLSATSCVQLGGKGANLAEMCHIGLRVPPGLTISTETCAAFHAEGMHPPHLRMQRLCLHSRTALRFLYTCS